MLPIRISVGSVNLHGELTDSDDARALARALPMTADFQVWGDELHFEVGLEDRARRNAGTRVAVGDLAYWSAGERICIFFGPTPASPAEEPVAAVPVKVCGRVEGAERLRGVKEAGQITITGADPPGH